jgi:hypothetical protein
MTDQAKKGIVKDTISQIKKGTEGVKDIKTKEEGDIDWELQENDDEDDVPQKKSGLVVEQGKVGTDKPKKLKDLFGDTPQTQKKPRPYKPKEG